MNLNYPEEYYSKSSSEETDDTGSGRSYECIFCKRGFTTAQALGGHMNIHRKDKANNKNKPTTFPLSSSNKDDNMYAADVEFCSEIPSHNNPTAGGNNYYSTVPEVDANNNHRQVYFPATACGVTPSHVQYGDVLCVENQQDHHLFGQDWSQTNLSLNTNPFCAGEIKDDKFEDYEEDGLDLELRLGRQP